MTEPFWLWWVVGAYLALATALLLASVRSRAYEGAVLRFQSSVGVDLSQEMGQKLRKRMLRNRRSSLVGGAIGILVSAFVISTQTADPGALETMSIAAAAFAGPALAVSITTLLTTRTPADSRVRYARSQAVELSDYVPATERWLARGPATLAVLYFAAWGLGVWFELIPSGGRAALIGGAILSAISVASLLIFEIAGRRIVAMGNRVGSPEELVWEDAIRSQTVRDITSAPALVGLYAIVYSLPYLLDQGFLGWIGVAASAGVLVVLLITITLRPERHFLRRLWPELAATTGKPYGADATNSPYGTEP